ncbi:MAG TPA: hypothetical protein PKD09_15205 [Aggregatilinea sp.]|uniref:hypothetical protein n=1 Tax=Aggregatilinea sp. TaxID=2806333 RepID=UPI002CEEEA50|nr:hypothetical protein [Aggregatilinea sp.]HML22999.1 hypothetical protein [Aggregatilinea sp.]
MADTILYVEKDTDQMRSTLVAYGLASLLYRLADPGTSLDVRIVDGGSTYALVAEGCAPTDLLEYVAQHGLPVLLPAIFKPLSAGEKKQVESGVPEEEVLRKYIPERFPSQDVIDYGAEKQKVDETRQTKRKTREETDLPQRPRDYPLWAHLCSYFGKGSAMRIGYPLVVHAWHAHQGDQAVALLDLILRTYGVFPNDLEAARDEWRDTIKPELDPSGFQIFGWDGAQTDVSALSIVSPTTAQGSYTVSGARGVNTGTPDIFWLDIYLAFVGYMTAAMPFNADGDALLYYPIPRDIAFTAFEHTMQSYRNSDAIRHLYDYSNFMPRAKIDALSQIAFYDNMIKHYRDNMPIENAKPWDVPDINAISGLVGYYYKNISTQVPFDETTFALPAWLPLKADAAALDEARSVLDGHRDLIEDIRGDYAEELEILSSYRRFVTLGNAQDWIAFAIDYSQHRFNKMVDSPWMAHVSVELLEKTLMNNPQAKDYRPILENTGFRSVATAIRSCTVQLRYFKDVKNQQIAFKVRHGLGDDLLRRAHDPDHFIEDLGSFVHDYMRESSNVQALTGEERAFITEGDLYDVIALVSEYGSRVVASLLVASGYASNFTRKEQ